MTTHDDWQNWRDALAGKDVALHVDVPHPGYYKMRNGRGGLWMPVAIWRRSNGDMVCRVAGEMRDPNEVWTWCAKNPVSKEDAKFAFDNGGKWPGDAPPPIGDNSKRYAEGFEGIQAEINDYAELCRAFLAKHKDGIKTKADADQASNMADAIGKVKSGIAKRADEMREAEVRPHLDAQRDINAKYKPLIETGVTIAEQLRKVSADWTRAEQDRLQKIADETAAKERAKAEAARAAWDREQAANRAAAPADDPLLDLLDTPPPPSPASIVAEKVKVHVGGQRGNKRSLKTRRIAVIEDYAKALAFFAESSDVKAVIQTLAQRAVTARILVPGVSVREEDVL